MDISNKILWPRKGPNVYVNFLYICLFLSVQRQLVNSSKALSELSRQTCIDGVSISKNVDIGLVRIS